MEKHKIQTIYSNTVGFNFQMNIYNDNLNIFCTISTIKFLYITFEGEICKESPNNDGQQVHQYQQNKQ